MIKELLKKWTKPLHRGVYESQNALRAKIRLLERTLEEKRVKILGLKESLSERLILPQNQLEEYWNSKVSTLNSYRYTARMYNGEYIQLDPRLYFDNHNSSLPKVQGEDNDTKAMNCLKSVMSTVTYKSEVGENWKFSWETLSDRNGDCFAGYEKIYTKNGVKRIDKIEEGDMALSYDFSKGIYCYKPVIGHWSKGKLKVNRILFRNGQTIDVSSNHPMWVRQVQKNSKYEKKYLSDIDLTRWWKRKVPIAKKLPYEEIKPKFNKEIYRVIGHFLAEGWVGKSGKVGSSGAELDEFIHYILDDNNIPYTKGANGNGVHTINFLNSDLKDYLKKLKTSSFDIHLPEEILRLPEEHLEELLYGMWLGDGTKKQYPDKRGYKNNKEWAYSTSSEQLAKDIQRIMLQLGRPCHIWKQMNHKGVGNKPIWRINYTPTSNFNKDYGYNGISEVSIRSISEEDEVDMYDLTVADTHTVIMENGIITHQCEDGAILMANMMLHNDIPYWRIRLNVGNVKGGKHCWVTYLREEDDEWYTLDWCYWPKDSLEWLKWKDSENYFDIDWSFNKDYIFFDVNLDR